MSYLVVPISKYICSYTNFHKPYRHWKRPKRSCLPHPSINHTLISSSVWEIKKYKCRWNLKKKVIISLLFWKWFSFSQFMRDNLKRTEHSLLNSQTIMSHLIYWQAFNQYPVSLHIFVGVYRRLQNSPVQPVCIHSRSEQGLNLLNNNG